MRINRPLVSLVLATVGRTDDIGRLVQSLARQTCPDFELLVVDQNEDDRLLVYIGQAERLGIQVHHLRLSPPSLSGARNVGIGRARGDIVGFPDDDCWYEPGTLEAVRAAFSADPEWQAVVGQWVEQAQAGGGPDSTSELVEAQWRDFRGGNASSITLFLKRSLVERLGGFDERLGVGQWFGSGEEIDLVLRALGAGAVIGRWPQARVHHRYSSTASDRSGLTWHAVVRRARGVGALYIKHRMSVWTIVRGLVAPPITALAGGRGLKESWLAVAMCVGRLQGALRWTIRKRSSSQ